MSANLGQLLWIISHGLPGATGWMVIFLGFLATAIAIVRALGWLAGSVAYSLRKLHDCRLAWDEFGFARGGMVIICLLVAVVLALLALSLLQVGHAQLQRRESLLYRQLSVTPHDEAVARCPIT